jgi:hypothetical protein
MTDEQRVKEFLERAQREFGYLSESGHDPVAKIGSTLVEMVGNMLDLSADLKSGVGTDDFEWGLLNASQDILAHLGLALDEKE